MLFNFKAYPFIRITAAFILGIVSFHYLSDYIPINWVTLTLSSLLFAILGLLGSLRFRSIIGVMGLIILFQFGYLRLEHFRDDFKSDNLLYLQEQLHSYQGIIFEEPQAKKKTNRVVLQVHQGYVNDSIVPISGKVNLYLDKEKSKALHYGDVLLVKGQPNRMEGPANPGEFDYRNYLVYNNIYHQQFVGTEFEVLGNSPPSNVKSLSLKLRRQCRRVVTNLVENPEVRGIVLALVLGVKDELGPDLQMAYSAAGAMHVLAVSGLHVGIIYMLILSLFRKVGITGKRGRWVLALVSIVVLWSYAFVTGMSPSVLRAVTMFSFVAIAKATRRNTNIYNTLAASAFVLLWFNPYLIMSVGFQLSFLAVFGIVFLQPKFYGLLKFENWLLDKVWTITCVSVAAQIATGPLSVLYFHQFPSYFLISNLFIIPAAFIILLLGLGLLSFGWVPYLGIVLAWCLDQVVTITNSLVLWVEGLPGSVLDGIYFKTYETWLIYAVILFLVMLFIRKRFRYFTWALAMSLCFCLSQLVGRSKHLDSTKIDFFDVSNASVMDFVHGAHARLEGDSAFVEDVDKTRFSIEPKRMTSYLNIDRVDDKLELQRTGLDGAQLYVFNQSSILRIFDTNFLSYHSSDPLKVDFLIISHNSIRDLNQLKDVLVFKNLVLDNSNRKNLVDRLTSQAETLNLKVFSTQESGFLELKLGQ